MAAPREWDPSRSLVEHSSEAMFVLDAGGRFVWANPSCEALTGRSPAGLCGVEVTALLQPELCARAAAALRQRLSEPERIRLEVEIIRDGGGRREVVVDSWLESDGEGAVLIYGVARDITEAKLREERARQAERVQALSLLAGGVAHDFNNLLMTIASHAHQLRECGIDAALIENAAERGIEIARRLLEAARGAKPQAVRLDLHATLVDVIGLLKQTLEPAIRVEAELTAAESTVLADSAQMYQVFLNLALNAKDAMPQGGELRFSTRVVEEVSGRMLAVEVRDTGTGIPGEILERIFEPFFTTKDPEKGTGMGLAMVNGIVKNHRGRVLVASSNTEGTAFQVLLPLAAAARASSGL
jgi:PAS domain S-box-containing protein